MKRILPLVLLACAPALGLAQHAGHPAAAAQVAQAGVEPSDGEIRKVDKANGRITIKHGEIKNVHMGPMTMSFGVKSPAMLEGVAAGDKVKFTAEEVKGELVVTSIRKVK
jgi:Cu(I)/Ag(I) efflux system protein CusF